MPRRPKPGEAAQRERMEPQVFDAIILAGGAAKRLGGADKAEIVVGGKRLLDHTVEAVSEARQVVVVGPRRVAPQRVRWAREEPPGGGPTAALAAGVELVAARTVVVLAVDLPFVDDDVVRRLVRAARGRDGALLVDAAGSPQYLAAAYDTAALRSAAASLDRVAGVSLKRLVEGLELARVPGGAAARDCDGWDEIEDARRLLERGQGGISDAR